MEKVEQPQRDGGAGPCGRSELQADGAMEPLLGGIPTHCGKRARWAVTVATLLSLQLGWGLWLMPADFARLGWIPAAATILVLTLLTVYSGVLISRFCALLPGAVLFGDIGQAALGVKGRTLVYWIVYTLDATRCVILHLAATQSLQHAVNDDSIPLYVYGAAVAVLALLFAQIKSLAELGWFLSLGTAAQLVALVLVMGQLLSCTQPCAATELVHTGDWAPAIVAVMNIIFAFGGQFAFVEIITAMRSPARFPAAVALATGVMALTYAALGAVGYRSQGEDVTEIIIFGLGSGPVSRAAAGAILFQAIAQYLVNLNVWTHNILTLLARRRAAACRATCSIQNSADHAWAPWLAASAFVIAYSYAISIAVPFFSTLVGLVVSVCYLTCAYTLPCWFTLRLLGDRLGAAERVLCWVLIPLSLALSAAGFYASVLSLVQNLGGTPL